jgi:hypothetical protein
MEKQHLTVCNHMAEDRAKYRTTLQCSATTTKGRRCRNTTDSWDYAGDPAFAEARPLNKPFTDPDWWVCNKHAPTCPHCIFVAKGVWKVFLQPRLLWEPDNTGDTMPAGRGLWCPLCVCTWDPRLELVASGEQCPVLGVGPEPGALGALFFDRPDVVRDGMDYALEEERKHKLLREWKRESEP